VIDRATGLSYAEYVSRRILGPVGMHDSGDLNDGVAATHLAPGFDPGFPPERLGPATAVSRGWLEGNGSLFATAADMLRWLRVVRQRLAERGAVTYGWGERSGGGRHYLEQNGRIPIGYASYVALWPVEDVEVVVLANIQSDVVTRLGPALAAMALGDSISSTTLRDGWDAPVPDSAALADCAGRYQIAPGFVLGVRASARGLLLAGPDGLFLPLDYTGRDRAFFRVLYVPIRFVRDAAGRIQALDWNGQFTAARLAP